jgi:MarR family 2-MHQ and catechol resistance regulon transcriptional repressor
MGTRYKGRAAEVRALDAYIKLLRAANSVSARLERRLDEKGVTETQFGVLEALYHVGPMCQKLIGEKVLKSGGNITVVVDNLEKRRLVRRVRDDADRRYVTVSLTADGKSLVERLLPGHVGAIADELGALTAAEQEELGRLCRKLGRGG